MKRLSFQWRITLMTALLIAAVCITMNLLLFHSGTTYLDSLGTFVLEYAEGDVAQDQDALIDILDLDSEDAIYVDLSEEQFQQFMDSFSSTLQDSKASFGQRGWLITAGVTLLGAVIAYFISGHMLKPLREFTRQAEQIHAKNMTDARLDEETAVEFRRLSRALNQMLTRLSRSFDAQRQFVGNAAHELRTPLALMQAQLDLYAAEHPEDPPDTAEAIRLLHEQTEGLSHTVRTLLGMSELESIPRVERIDLAPLIEEVLTDLEPLADEKDITLEQIGENISLTGSDVLLYRMIFNLVENSIKYNRHGGNVTVSASQNGSHAVIQIRDTGEGIPEEYQKSVFQPFFRVDKSRQGGVGLGLPLVWEVARLHGGLVTVEESSSAGTIISITLPVETGLSTDTKRKP